MQKGCGLDLSNLAFKGARVRNAAESSSGAVSFMELYSHVTGLISQNGRRGALMLSMDVTHPDIEEFIEIKQDLDKVTKANISVKVTDEFMNAVKEDKDFELRFTRKETGEEKIKTVKAKELFRKICECAWNTGEPGVLFWDRIKNYNLLSNDEEYELAGTNPCSEIPLPSGGACLLGSINLSAFVKEPFTPNAYFDYIEFSETVGICIEELDKLLDEGVEGHPLEIQKKSAKKWRPIGCGTMGLSDMLIKMGIRYGSEEAVALCDNIGYCMANNAINKSVQLAKAYGSPFSKKKISKIMESAFFANHAGCFEETKKYGLRNGQLLTIAPTGSLSNVLGVSGGIEPIFANSYTRKTQTLHDKDTYYKVYTPIVKEYMDMYGITDEKDLPDYFVTAPEIPYEERIKMQAAFQRHIDNAISSTVNLPETATVEDIMDLYMKAWENGLKGITVFKDNCKRVGVLTTTKKEEPETITELPEPIHSETDGLARGEIMTVSDDAVGLKRKLMTGCGSLHCIALFDKNTGQLVETYLAKGSTGGCNNFMVGLSRMISLAARLGGSIYDIIDQLKSTGSCPSYAVRRAVHKDTSVGSCCPMAVGNALLDMYEEFNGLGKYKDIPPYGKMNADGTGELHLADGKTLKLSPLHEPKMELRAEAKCPQCGSKLDHEGGCDICRDCGWTKCD